MGGSTRYPDPDPLIGIAAEKAAITGEESLKFMKEQAAITNQWAKEDRARHQGVFQPLEDELIAEALSWDTPQRRAARQDQAQVDVMQGIDIARGSTDRRLTAMGVNPASGRGSTTRQTAALDEGLAIAGARNLAGRQVDQEAEAKKAAVVNMGRGFAVNPATSMGLSNGAVAQGSAQAMQGYNQAGNLLNQQFSQQMQKAQMEQMGQNALMGGLGSLAGMAIMSSRDYKEDKAPPERSLLDAVRDMPVEDWKYKDGIADEGQHTGPYAEDFQAATGLGDGRSIPVADAIGVTMGAVQELDKKVQGLIRALDPSMMQGAA